MLHDVLKTEINFAKDRVMIPLQIHTWLSRLKAGKDQPPKHTGGLETQLEKLVETSSEVQWDFQN